MSWRIRTRSPECHEDIKSPAEVDAGESRSKILRRSHRLIELVEWRRGSRVLVFVLEIGGASLAAEEPALFRLDQLSNRLCVLGDELVEAAPETV